MDTQRPYRVEASFLVSRTDDVEGIAHADVVVTHSIHADVPNLAYAIATLDQALARVSGTLNRLATL